MQIPAYLSYHTKNQKSETMYWGDSVFRKPPIQQLSLTTIKGESLCFSFGIGEKRKELSVSILKDKTALPIRTEDLPQEFRSVRSWEELHWLLAQVCIRTVLLSNKEVRLDLRGRIMGGNPYKQALADLKEALQDIVNPYLANAITSRFRLRSAVDWQVANGLDGWLEDLSVPPEIIRFVEALSQAIKGKAETLPNSLDELLADLRDQIEEILPEPVNANQLWEELRTLFAIPHFNCLKNSQLRLIYQEVHRQDASVDRLRDIINGVFEAEAIRNINVLLSEQNLDLDTLLGEIIENRPQRPRAYNEDRDFGRDAELDHSQIVGETVNQIVNNLIEDGALLDQLVDNWISTKLTNVDFALIAGTRLQESLELASKQYEELIMQQRSAQQILNDAVREANYRRLISKGDDQFVLRAIKLLKKAHEYASPLKDTEAVIVIGKTGSGKSSTICRLLGAKLKRTNNAGGDIVYELEDPSEELPRIGQALGTSETLYARGYSLPNSAIQIIDCPGLDDTRGKDHELCASLSMDLAITGLQQMRALVLVIALQDFVINRGNPVIDLVLRLQERFPHVFDEKHSDHRKLFLLVTKKEQFPAEVSAQLELRLWALRNEERDRLNKLQDELSISSETKVLGDFNSRWVIWNTLCHMWDRGQISLVDLGNRRQGTRLMQTLIQKEQIGDPKLVYYGALTGKDMHYKFGGDLVLVTVAWTEAISNYLTVLPTRIQALDSSCVEAQHQIRDLKLGIAQNQKRVEQLKLHIEQLRSLVEDDSRKKALDPITLGPILALQIDRSIQKAGQEIRYQIAKAEATRRAKESQLAVVQVAIAELLEAIQERQKIITVIEDNPPLEPGLLQKILRVSTYLICDELLTCDQLRQEMALLQIELGNGQDGNGKYLEQEQLYMEIDNLSSHLNKLQESLKNIESEVIMDCLLAYTCQETDELQQASDDIFASFQQIKFIKANQATWSAMLHQLELDKKRLAVAIYEKLAVAKALRALGEIVLAKREKQRLDPFGREVVSAFQSFVDRFDAEFIAATTRRFLH